MRLTRQGYIIQKVQRKKTLTASGESVDEELKTCVGEAAAVFCGCCADTLITSAQAQSSLEQATIRVSHSQTHTRSYSPRRFDDCVPVSLAQHRGLPVIEYPSFNQAVDAFFSQLEQQRLELSQFQAVRSVSMCEFRPAPY